jgi:hypothetical protein
VDNLNDLLLSFEVLISSDGQDLYDIKIDFSDKKFKAFTETQNIIMCDTEGHSLLYKSTNDAKEMRDKLNVTKQGKHEWDFLQHWQKVFGGIKPQERNTLSPCKYIQFSTLDGHVVIISSGALALEQATNRWVRNDRQEAAPEFGEAAVDTPKVLIDFMVHRDFDPNSPYSSRNQLRVFCVWNADSDGRRLRDTYDLQFDTECEPRKRKADPNEDLKMSVVDVQLIAKFKTDHAQTPGLAITFDKIFKYKHEFTPPVDNRGETVQRWREFFEVTYPHRPIKFYDTSWKADAGWLTAMLIPCSMRDPLNGLRPDDKYAGNLVGKYLNHDLDEAVRRRDYLMFYNSADPYECALILLALSVAHDPKLAEDKSRSYFNKPLERLIFRRLRNFLSVPRALLKLSQNVLNIKKLHMSKERGEDFITTFEIKADRAKKRVSKISTDTLEKFQKEMSTAFFVYGKFFCGTVRAGEFQMGVPLIFETLEGEEEQLSKNYCKALQRTMISVADSCECLLNDEISVLKNLLIELQPFKLTESQSESIIFLLIKYLSTDYISDLKLLIELQTS